MSASKIIARKLLEWYRHNGRDLPFRKTKNPYHIWICEIIFQQTRIVQGMAHYENFIAKFPDVRHLADAPQDEVLLSWKGLGYYSRALNVYKAARQIMTDFGGRFPETYEDIISLKGVGKYTASAISSICFGERRPAVDGNFYRVLSRLFVDDYDISGSGAFSYFNGLALQIMPEKNCGIFNEAMMDLGSLVCKPNNPDCGICPLNADCLAFQAGRVSDFPVKSKKTKITDLQLQYFFVYCGNQFLIKQRGDDFIWKKLYEFNTEISQHLLASAIPETVVFHKLTHKNLTVSFFSVEIFNENQFQELVRFGGFFSVNLEEAAKKSFPKPLQDFLEKRAAKLLSGHRNS